QPALGAGDHPDRRALLPGIAVGRDAGERAHPVSRALAYSCLIPTPNAGIDGGGTMMRRSWIGLIAAGLCAIACSAVAQNQPVKVVATFSILGDLVKSVGGDKVAVVTLVGPDADAHTYQPTPRDAKAVADAQLLVTNGFGLEGWLDRLKGAAKSQARVVVA